MPWSCSFSGAIASPYLGIGWRFDHCPRELILGLVLFIPFHFLAAVIEAALLQSGLHAAAPPSFLQAAGGLAQSLLGLLLVTVVAVAEESIFRGYLILRLMSISSSPGLAVILSALIFSLGHGYEGSAGLITVMFMGSVFAVIFLWRHSLIAPIVMHFLQDFLGIVVLPLLGGH